MGRLSLPPSSHFGLAGAPITLEGRLQYLVVPECPCDLVAGALTSWWVAVCVQVGHEPRVSTGADRVRTYRASRGLSVCQCPWFPPGLISRWGGLGHPLSRRERPRPLPSVSLTGVRDGVWGCDLLQTAHEPSDVARGASPRHLEMRGQATLHLQPPSSSCPLRFSWWPPGGRNPADVSCWLPVFLFPSCVCPRDL